MGLFGKKSVSKDELARRKKELDSVNTRKIKLRGNKKIKEKTINKEFARLENMKKNEFYFEFHKINVKIDDNFVRITRSGLNNKLLVGSSGEKAIRIDSISSVQMKKPKMTSGYIQFTLSGNSNSQGIFDASHDENSILFTDDEVDIAIMVKEKVEELIVKPRETSPKFSAADELRKFKELLDDGIITETEFEEKKVELLGK